MIALPDGRFTDEDTRACWFARQGATDFHLKVSANAVRIATEI
jgi:hypothetical protein